jgi:hypothetical protein
MTWLKRLWCTGTMMTRDQVEQLRAELPDTEIWCQPGDESTGGTWRYAPSYYEMRDAFHMYYMTITGERTQRLDEEELADIQKVLGLVRPRTLFFSEDNHGEKKRKRSRAADSADPVLLWPWRGGIRRVCAPAVCDTRRRLDQPGQRESGFAQPGLRHVADLRRCQQLRSLDLRGNDIEPEDLRALQEALRSASSAMTWIWRRAV